jgi:hypothetical protein
VLQWLPNPKDCGHQSWKYKSTSINGSECLSTQL